MLASKYKLDNLILIIDRNNIQIDGTTDDVLPLEPLADKFRSFGWAVIETAGNDVSSLIKAFTEAQAISGQPIAIIAKTMPGKGVSFMEGRFDWHGKAPTKEQGDLALKELENERKLLEVA
jgi:transketolase